MKNVWRLGTLEVLRNVVYTWVWALKWLFVSLFVLMNDHISPPLFVSLCLVCHLTLKPLLISPFRLVIFVSFLCTLFALSQPFPLSLYWWNLPSSWVLRLCLVCFLSACVHYSAAALWPQSMTVSQWCYRRERERDGLLSQRFSCLIS